MSKTEMVKARKHALPSVVLYGLAGTLFFVGVLLVLVLIGWYGSTFLTDGRWHTFTIVYAYWLTRRVIAIVISGGVLILIGTYMSQKETDNSMSVIPVAFSTEHKSMLEHCKMIS